MKIPAHTLRVALFEVADSLPGVVLVRGPEGFALSYSEAGLLALELPRLLGTLAPSSHAEPPALPGTPATN